jgi:hypothetical protein
VPSAPSFMPPIWKPVDMITLPTFSSLMFLSTFLLN